MASSSSSSSSSSDAAAIRKHFILQYAYTPDILEKRGPYRAQHLGLAKALKEQGKVVMAGAFADPVDGGVFIFHTSHKRDVEDFVKQDPYVKHNLVTSYSIREWTVSI